MTCIVRKISTKAWHELLAVASQARREKPTGQTGYYSPEAERYFTRGGAFANSAREGLGYTGAHVADALRALGGKRAGWTSDEAEGLLMQALLAYDDIKSRVRSEGMSPAVKQQRKRVRFAVQGRCNTCGSHEIAEGKRYCNLCNKKANERQMLAYWRRKEARKTLTVV